MKSDLISVIIPVYNTKDYIEKCVQSVLQQTYSPIEIIMVDDGSVDGSGELLDSLSQAYSLSVVHKQNGGAASARNAGLDIANGEWIVFADSDDVYSEVAIERLVDMCKRNHCTLACCGVATDYSELSHGNCEQPEIKVYNRDIGMKLLLEEQILSYIPSKIYHKSLFSENLRIPEKMTFEDLYIMPEIFERADRIAQTTEKLYYYCQDRGGNVSSIHSVQHSLDLSVAQRHRYILATKHPELPENTKQLLLFRAVRASLGAYRLSLFQKNWGGERRKITEFFSRYRWDILHCSKLTMVHKFIVLGLSIDLDMGKRERNTPND